ncbi:hypothetical protein SCD_n02418 [Sulfuricella denitrificans skB26]|uniref:Uncharacterized protein n=1 Tax=Sulfuricella denitrificans (strain DSM 22764 / NBRC 105220 / skB26) TaxID=1163617 RepID=S6AIZ7_SULDS|nr:hypothetical protein [Sulfuricella denitrificans]BAN36226.1 hypothetical protein SCD_n02418 [Sulfuricella denitrificans skB26]
MKRFLIAAALAATTACLAAPALATDVGVSISIGQPGFYGQIDIGGYPPPQVIYRQPMIIERVPMNRPPVYLRVPPGHAKHWSKNCHKYNACGERVYFVQDNWYNREYVPRYQEQHRDRRDDRRDERRDDRRGKQNNDRHGNNQGQGRDR